MRIRKEGKMEESKTTGEKKGNVLSKRNKLKKKGIGKDEENKENGGWSCRGRRNKEVEEMRKKRKK